MIKYLEIPENRVNWIDEKDKIGYINRLYALMIVEHINGDSNELEYIATYYPKSIQEALEEKLIDNKEGENPYNPYSESER